MSDNIILNTDHLLQAKATAEFARINQDGPLRAQVVAQLVAEKKAYWIVGREIGDPYMKYGLSASEEMGGEPLIAIFKNGGYDVQIELGYIEELFRIETRGGWTFKPADLVS